MAQETKRIEAIVHGRVQGVSFRYYTRKRAYSLGVTGWVANHPDGTVRLVAEGDRQQLEELIDFLHKGPPAARVEDVDVDWTEPMAQFNSFNVRWL